MAISANDQAAKDCIAFLVERLALGVQPSQLIALDVRFAVDEAVVVKMEIYPEAIRGNP